MSGFYAPRPRTQSELRWSVVLVLDLPNLRTQPWEECWKGGSNEGRTRSPRAEQSRAEET